MNTAARPYWDTSVRLCDFAVVPVPGAVGAGIALGEFLNGAWKWTGYRHVLGYAGYYEGIPKEWDLRWVVVPPHSRDRPLSGHVVFEAHPGGARYRFLEGRPEDIPGALWSTGLLSVRPSQRDLLAGQMPVLQGTPYSAADYAAIAAHRLHLAPAGGWLQDYVASSRHMICSQLWDYMYAQAGIPLFSDGRWPGYVTPWDLAALLIGHLAATDLNWKVPAVHPVTGIPLPGRLLAR